MKFALSLMLILLPLTAADKVPPGTTAPASGILKGSAQVVTPEEIPVTPELSAQMKGIFQALNYLTIEAENLQLKAERNKTQEAQAKGMVTVLVQQIFESAKVTQETYELDFTTWTLRKKPAVPPAK